MLDNMEFKSIDMTAKFSNFEVINSDFTRCRCNVFYTGRNRNYSDITEDALRKFISRKGYANVPVVAHLMKKDDGSYVIGGHDQKLILSNQSIELIDETVPFGVIPEDCNPSMDLITERSGEKRQYFSVDIILWTHRYPILEAAYSDEIYFNQSMEITFTDYDYDGDYVVVNDFNMSALCLLYRSMNSKDNVEPCFESSAVKRFSIDEEKFKENFELMLEKYKQYESDVSTSVQNKETKNNTDSVKGEQNMELSKFVEVLSTVKIEGTEENKYSLLNATDISLFVLDMEDLKPYGFDYAVVDEDGVNKIIIDFDSKVEMSLSATEKIVEEGFVGFSIKSEIDNRVNSGIDAKAQDIEACFNEKYNTLADEYNKLNENYADAVSELKAFQKADADAKAKAHEDEINALFDTYADKLGKCADFLVYKAKINPSEVSVDEVSEKLIFMYGKHMMDSASKKNFNYEPTITKVNPKVNEESSTSRYGHLLDKYMK